MSVVTDMSVAFIKQMLQPLLGTPTATKYVSSQSTIEADVAYSLSYTGKVSGKFSLVGLDPATTQLCPISVSTPGLTSGGALREDFFGTVYGAVPTANVGDTIQAYRETDTLYAMPATATVAAGGFFSIDLSPVPTYQVGAWKLGLLHAGALVGVVWPQPNSYTNLQVQASIITDAIYPLATKPANVDGKFYFPSINAGRKMFQLINASTGAILAAAVPTTGNLRSYQVTSGQPGYGTNFIYSSYSYDQAICLQAAVALREGSLAKQLVAGLVALQTVGGAQDGGFIFSGQQLAPSYGDASYRTGAHAICTFALLSYMQAYPNEQSGNYAACATRAMTWLAAQLCTTGPQKGLYLGGVGIYSGSPQVLDQGYTLTWAATEHNIDSWETLTLAATVLNNAAYKTAANAVGTAIMGLLWDPAHTRFFQGYTTTGPDTADPLDTHSWGAIFLTNYGHPELAAAVMSDLSLAPFKVTQGNLSGYAPFYFNGGYPGAIPSIWSEGTFGVAMAFNAMGLTEQAQAVVAGLSPGQKSDGGFQYVTTYDTIYQLTTSEAAVGAAWCILATLGYGIWFVT